jgi:hypothetical protein
MLLGHNVTQGQDDLEDQEAQKLQKEMEDQRSQYQAILKAVGGEGVENDPDFQKMVKEGIKDPQQMLQKLQEIRQKNGKDTNIGTIGGGGGKAQGMKLKDLLKGNASEMVKLMLQQFAHVGPDQLKARLLAANEGKPQGEFLKNNPRFLNFVVKAFKHPNALPNFAKILDQRQKLTYFVGVNIFIFIFGMWYKRVQKNRNQDKSATKSMNQFVFRTIFFFGLRIGAFIAFFHKEVYQIASIFKNSMFS